MHRDWTISCLALVAAFAIASGAVTQATASSKPTGTEGKASSVLHRGSTHAARHIRGRVAYALPGYRVSRGSKTGFADLVGDPQSGLGFYPLPIGVRMAAARYRFSHQRPWWQNPVLAAMAADAVRTPCFVPADRAYRCGVFNPIDGVGTPFFAGYYSRGW